MERRWPTWPCVLLVLSVYATLADASLFSCSFHTNATARLTANLERLFGQPVGAHAFMVSESLSSYHGT